MESLNSMIEKNQPMMIQGLQKLIQVPSVWGPAENDMPFGMNIHTCLIDALEYARSLGFSVKNVDNMAGHIEFGQGEEILGILGHLDVVPAGSDWSMDPFKGIVDKDRLYGRGALDDKGPVMAALYAMLAVKESGIPLNKRVRLILGLNEENGSKCIKHYLKKEEMPTLSFTPDAEFPVIHGEMGIINFAFKQRFGEPIKDGNLHLVKISGGNSVNMVPDYAEALLIGQNRFQHILDAFNLEKNSHIECIESDGSLIIKAYGLSTHGSTPEKGVNAIAHLLEFLNCLDLEISDAATFIRLFALFVGGDLHGERLCPGIQDTVSGKLILNVGNMTLNEYEGTINVNMRYPVTTHGDAILDVIRETLLPTSIALEVIEHKPPLYLPADHPLVETLMDVYREETGDIHSQPIVIGGGTYAKQLKNCVAFGPLFPGREDTVHQKDEYILIEDLKKMTQIYAKAIIRLCSK